MPTLCLVKFVLISSLHDSKPSKCFICCYGPAQMPLSGSLFDFLPTHSRKKTIPLPVSLTFRTDLSSLMAGMYFILLCILSAQLRVLSMGFCKTSLSTGTFAYVISFDLQMTNKEKRTVIILMRRNQGSKSLINVVQSHIVITGARS